MLIIKNQNGIFNCLPILQLSTLIIIKTDTSVSLILVYFGNTKFTISLLHIFKKINNRILDYLSLCQESNIKRFVSRVLMKFNGL